MLFDVTLPTVLDVRVLPLSDNSEFCMLVAMAGLATPIPQPDGQPLVMPTGIVRVPLGFDSGMELKNQLETELPKLRRASQIETATSLQGVDKLMNFEKGLRG